MIIYEGLDKISGLEELRDFIGDCQRCKLSLKRTNVVFGSGDARSKLLFVGEGPGFHEDKHGLPFVGQAGKLLDTLLATIGLTRDDVFIANVVKCRPPNNRDPEAEEVAACSPFLKQQIRIIRPRIIATLGNHASKLLTGKDIGISKIHGKIISGKNYDVFPIYHPAAALYMRTTLAALEEDFLKLSAILAGLSRDDDKAAVTGNADEAGNTSIKQPQQLGLFDDEHS